MSRLSLLAASIPVVLAVSADAAIIHQQPDPALTRSVQLNSATLSAQLLPSVPASNILFQLFSDSYNSSGDISQSGYTRLAASSDVKIAVVGTQVLKLAVDEPVSGSSGFSAGQVDLANYFGHRSAFSTIWDRYYGGSFGGGTAVNGYLGLKLDDGADTYYGWMRVAVTGAYNQRIDVYEWAFNTNSGEMILAGQTEPIPEPTSFAMMALAAMAMLRRRRA